MRYRIVFWSEELICGNFHNVQRSTKWVSEEEILPLWDKYRSKGGQIHAKEGEI